MATIGVLGLGKIGRAVANRVVRAGDELVMHNRTRTTAEEVATATGGRVVVTPQELTEECSVVWGSLNGWEAVRTAYLGEGGLLDGASPTGCIFVELGTLEPQEVQELHEAIAAAGHHFVYAAVSGRPIDIEEGRGFIMASGREAMVAEPILSAMGSFHYVGDNPGDAATMKLAMSVMVFANLLSAAEALNLAVRGGIEPALAFDLFLAGPVGSPLLELRRDAFIEPAGLPVQATLDLAIKNYGLIEELAAKFGAVLPQADLTAHVFRTASAAGWGDLDVTRIAGYIAEVSDFAASGSAAPEDALA